MSSVSDPKRYTLCLTPPNSKPFAVQSAPYTLDRTPYNL